jgi:mono/diheme cytochrome c family protein
MQRTNILVVVLVTAASIFLSVTVAAQYSRTEKPPPTKAEFEQGAQLFSQICSHCHGPQMVNPGNWSFDLRKFPHNDRARFFNSVMNGKNAMPPWKDILKPDEIEAIWAYVRTGGKEP